MEEHSTVVLDESDTKQIFDNGFVGNIEEPLKKQSRWRKYWKTIAAAGFLLLAGIIFLIVAFVDLQNKQTTTRGVAFLVIGTLCALPGGYQCYLIWQAYKRRPGYSFSQVPSYDY